MKVVLIHTSLVSHEALCQLFAEILPQAQLQHIIDDSLLAEVSAAGHVTPGVQARMNSYVMNAASLKPDLIFNQCSSVGEAFDCAVKQTDCRTLKIDWPMAQRAAELCPSGGKIGVVATVSSTLAPSTRLVEKAIAESGKEIDTEPKLIDGALAMLMSGNREQHNMLVKQAVVELSRSCNVIVLAQGSMLVLEELLNDIPVPVLTSPRLAVERARDMLVGR